MKTMQRILTTSAVIGIFLVMAASAYAMLSNVGPHLSSNPQTAETQVEAMLHHDKAIQAFYAQESHGRVTMQDIASAKVIGLKFGHCRIGVSKLCPFNTGKDSSGNVVKTSYRTGEVRPVAFVEIEIGKERFKFTLESPCVNLLSPLFPVAEPVPPKPPKAPPHIPVSPKKPIVFQLVSTSYSVSISSSEASAKCPTGTVAGLAGSGAGAEAVAHGTFKVYRQAHHSWSALFGKINSISTTTYTSAGSGISVTCESTGTPPPPPCHSCHEEEHPEPPEENHPPQISCVYPPHVLVGESQQMWCEASDPDGDALTINVNGDSHLQVSSTIPVSERWDGTPCPSGVHCYRSTLWGKSAGTAHIKATVTAKGGEGHSEGTVEVPEDIF